MYRNFIAVK